MKIIFQVTAVSIKIQDHKLLIPEFKIFCATLVSIV